MGKYSALSHLGFGKEVTWGTAVAATKWIAATNGIKPESVYKMVEDKGLRGAFGGVPALYQGVRHATFDFETMFYPDDCGLLLLALLGTDTVTGVGPYVHTFSLAAAQPPSYTIHDYDGISQKPYPGCVLTELGFKFAIDGELQVTTKWMSKVPGTVETADTTSFSVAKPVLGWMATPTLNSAINANLIAFDLTLKRESLVQYTANGAQDPKMIHVGRLTASGKLTFEPEDDTELTLLQTNAQAPLVIDMLTGQSTNELKFSIPAAAFKKGTETRSKVLVEREFDFDAVGATSPITATLTNSTATY